MANSNDSILTLDKSLNLLPNKPLLLFDGVCNLCSTEVQFLIKHDSEGKLMFTSQQSDKGQAILKSLHINHLDLQTVILIEEGIVYTRSSAIIHTFNYLDGVWQFGKYLKIIPSFIADFFYKILAANRYKWFGKKEACWIPTPALRSRFWE